MRKPNNNLMANIRNTIACSWEILADYARNWGKEHFLPLQADMAAHLTVF